jgi:hypothetical protein
MYIGIYREKIGEKGEIFIKMGRYKDRTIMYEREGSEGKREK